MPRSPRPTDRTAAEGAVSTAEPIRAWPLSDIGGPEWTAWQIEQLEAESAERVAELKRVIRRRDTAARKAVRLTTTCMELRNRIWALRAGQGR